jgi:hypothetical protein
MAFFQDFASSILTCESLGNMAADANGTTTSASSS